MSDAPSLAEVNAVWDAQARADPLWAVLSEPNKRERRWDLSGFMATGAEHVQKMLRRYAELGGTFPDRDLAVDFGSGVGRISQPLANHFSRVVGIDISETMVNVARRLNSHGERVEYVRNAVDNLEFLGDRSVCFVHTFITLQHLPPECTKRYLDEFFRVAKPGGGVVFQLLSHYSDSFLPTDRDDSPVPETAMRADFSATSQGVPNKITAGADVWLKVEVVNRAGIAWTQSGPHPLQIGNRWVDDASGEVVLPDDGRTRLPGRVHPNETVSVELLTHAPKRAGQYRLRFDVVQEGVGWFSENGGATYEAIVEVIPASSPHEPEHAAPQEPDNAAGGPFEDLIESTYFEPSAFDMYPIPRAEVEALVRDHGAVLLGTDEWVSEWHSFTYYVQVRG